MEAVHYQDMVKVWPLRGGLQGLTAQGTPCRLMPGIAGWMHEAMVAEAEQRGDVQRMIGLRPQDLKQPDMNTPAESRRARKQRNRYARRDMRAENGQTVSIDADASE